MNLGIFTVYDQKAKAYLPPFFLPEEDMAIRVFGDCCNDRDHQFGRHPEDYHLFGIGHFDDCKGTINETSPQLVASGQSLLRPEENGRKETENSDDYSADEAASTDD